MFRVISFLRFHAAFLALQTSHNFFFFVPVFFKIDGTVERDAMLKKTKQTDGKGKENAKKG